MKSKLNLRSGEEKNIFSITANQTKKICEFVIYKGNTININTIHSLTLNIQKLNHTIAFLMRVDQIIPYFLWPINIVLLNNEVIKLIFNAMP